MEVLAVLQHEQNIKKHKELKKADKIYIKHLQNKLPDPERGQILCGGTF
jgi:hypothetical protein